MSALLDSFRDGYAALRDPDALQLGDGRRQALAALLADGLPGPREEAWKYTPLRALERRAFAAADPAPPACDPALLAARARQAFITFIFTLAHTGSVLMELEDLHQADDASLDLLNELFNACAGSPEDTHLTAACTARASTVCP